MNATRVAGLILYHDVPHLGAGVATGIVELIKRYADLASLDHLPPITLSGEEFAKAWSEIVGIEGCSGNAGPSDEELALGGEFYECLFLCVPSSSSPRPGLHPTTLEGTIAHEIAHLRWKTLRHGPEFNARVTALLRGAKFPLRGGWSLTTQQKVGQARKEYAVWLESVIRSGGGPQV